MTKAYTHLGSAGNLPACERVRDSLDDILSAKYESGVLKGYWLALVGSRLEAEEKLVPEEAIERVRSTFPFLYLLVNYAEDDPDHAVVEAVSNAGFALAFEQG